MRRAPKMSPPLVRVFLIFTVAVFAVGMMGMNWRNKEERFQYQSI